MTTTVKRSELLQSLLAIAPAVKTERTTMPVLSTTYLVVDKTNTITVRGASLEAYAQSTCPCAGDWLLGPVCVPSSSLLHFVSQAGDDLTLAMDNTKLRIASAGSVVCLSCLSGNSFPPPPDTNPNQTSIRLSLDAPALADCIRQVLWAADPSEAVKRSDYRIGCVNVVTGPTSMQATATDKIVAAQSINMLMCDQAEFTIGSGPAAGLADNLDRPGAYLEVSPNNVTCHHGSGLFSAQRLTGEYYPMKMLTDDKNIEIYGLFPIAKLHEAMLTIRNICPDGYAPTILESTGEQVHISYRSAVNDYDMVLPIKSVPFKVKIDAFRLSKVAKAFDTKASVLLAKNQNSLKLSSGNIDVYLSTMNLGDPPPVPLE